MDIYVLWHARRRAGVRLLHVDQDDWPADFTVQVWVGLAAQDMIMKKLLLPMITAAGLLLGCSEKFTDVSDDPRIKPFVGGQYEIVGLVYAYGIREHPKAPVHYITLIPPPGIAGSEVGFKTPVPVGSRVTVIKVLKSNRVPDPNMDFVVRLEGAELPTQATTRIALFRGNEGDGFLQLNPAIYRKSPVAQ